MASRSPTATTPPAQTSSVPQSPIKEATPSPQQPVPFPPPQTFDVLPQLHGLLVRLLSPSTNSESPSGGTRGEENGTGPVASSGPSSTGPGQGQPQQQQPLVADNENNNIGGAPQAIPSSGAPAATMAAGVAALGPNAPSPLDVKDLPTAASSIKIRIQKARSVVDGLPDVHRSVEEQEQEIEELEERIAKLKEAISEFGRRAGT